MLDRLSTAAPTQRASINYRTPLVDRLNAIVTAQHLGHDRVSMRDPGGIYRDLRQVLPINGWKMRVWINNGSVVNPTTLPFNTVTFDSSNGFNTSTSIYTVPAAGFYQINAVAIAQTPAAAQNWATQLYVTTSQYFASTGSYLIQGPICSATSGGLGTTIGADLNDIYYFNLGDQVYVGAFYSIAPLGVGAQGGNWNFGNVQSYGEYWSMQLISG